MFPPDLTSFVSVLRAGFPEPQIGPRTDGQVLKNYKPILTNVAFPANTRKCMRKALREPPGPSRREPQVDGAEGGKPSLLSCQLARSNATF